jgi:hypothetical protein
MQKELINKIFSLNAQDLNQIIEAVKLRRNQLHCENARALSIGDRVSFGETDRGSRWNVPGSHLTLLEKETA